MAVQVGPQARAVAQLFGQSYEGTLGMYIPDALAGTMDLTQLLLVRQAISQSTNGSGPAIGTVNYGTTALTVPAGKAWALLGTAAIVTVPAASSSMSAIVISDNFGNAYAAGPSSAADANFAAPGAFVLQAPTQPWPILMTQSSTIRIWFANSAGTNVSTYVLYARYVEINTWGP